MRIAMSKGQRVQEHIQAQELFRTARRSYLASKRAIRRQAWQRQRASMRLDAAEMRIDVVVGASPDLEDK